MKAFKAVLCATSVLVSASVASATDLEVTHWWTSGGEAAAVAEFAKAFDATGNKWVDGAIAGGGDTARPIMISRITGGDPMGATQFNHGRQAEELVAGRPDARPDRRRRGRELEGHDHPAVACSKPARSTARSIACRSTSTRWQWLWLSNKAFDDAGVAGPDELERVRRGRAPALEAAGKIPLALGNQPWQSNRRLQRPDASRVAGKDLYACKVYDDKDADVAAGPEMAKVFKAAADARKMAAKSNVQDWNQATNLVITDQAGGQIMGDWAQGEFQVAGEVGRQGLHLPAGPRRQRDHLDRRRRLLLPEAERPREVEAAQEGWPRSDARRPETQVAFNLKKGSLPIRGDIDLSAANDCMKKGLEILAAGNVLPTGDTV